MLNFEGNVVGYLVGKIIKKQSTERTLKKQAELENMFILEELRSQGIGSKLVKEFFKWAKEKGIDNICVNTTVQNKLGIEFYKKQGFQPYYECLEINF